MTHAKFAVRKCLVYLDGYVLINMLLLCQMRLSLFQLKLAAYAD